MSMFLTLLVVTFLVAIAVATFVARLFDRPIASILQRIVAEELGTAWHKYMQFAIYVVGISGGVRIWELEKYITGRVKDEQPIVLTADRWVLEIYRTVIQTLQSTAWLLLVFFVAALIAFVLLRGFEIRSARAAPPPPQSS